MRILTGIQPSGAVHLGNYLGYFKQNIELLGEEENFLMIADLHALTTVHDPGELQLFRRELSKDFLACGFDPSRGTLFFQSDVPEHTELSWILACVTPMGLLERAVSFKERVQQGLEANAGLFLYPVLQAADILIYDADVVPIGKDQQQHLEKYVPHFQDPHLKIAYLEGLVWPLGLCVLPVGLEPSQRLLY